jgi:hypothetical protein
MTDLLSENPAALVQSAYGMSPTMQRYMKAQKYVKVINGPPRTLVGVSKQNNELNNERPFRADDLPLCAVPIFALRASLMHCDWFIDKPSRAQ